MRGQRWQTASKFVTPYSLWGLGYVFPTGMSLSNIMSSKPVKNFLKKIREEKNLTQDQLAELSGVTRYIISEFENEKRRPSPRTMSRLAEALECSYITLLTGKESSNEEKKKTANEGRNNYLEEAVKLTRKYYNNKGFDQELLMKISGHLSYLIEEYETASNQEKKEIVKAKKEQRALRLASEIFLNNLQNHK